MSGPAEYSLDVPRSGTGFTGVWTGRRGVFESRAHAQERTEPTTRSSPDPSFPVPDGGLTDPVPVSVRRPRPPRSAPFHFLPPRSTTARIFEGIKIRRPSRGRLGELPRSQPSGSLSRKRRPGGSLRAGRSSDRAVTTLCHTGSVASLARSSYPDGLPSSRSTPRRHQFRLRSRACPSARGTRGSRPASRYLVPSGSGSGRRPSRRRRRCSRLGRSATASPRANGDSLPARHDGYIVFEGVERMALSRADGKPTPDRPRNRALVRSASTRVRTRRRSGTGLTRTAPCPTCPPAG